MTDATKAVRSDYLRVVVVDEEFPYPANSGKRLRTLNLLKRLAPFFDITYIAHRNSDDAELSAAKQYLNSLGIRTIEVARKVPCKNGVTFYYRLLANLLSPLPYSVQTHASAEMSREITRLQKSGAVRLWHCEWTPYAQLFRDVALNPLVIAAHNVESMIWSRYAETEKRTITRWYIRHQCKKFKRFERWAFQRAERLIMVSDEDARRAVTSFVARDIDIIENGVDIRQYAQTVVTRNPKTMIFLGSLDWRPNLDGIAQFIERVFPAVLKEEPDTVLEIVGRNPPPRLTKEIQKYPNICLHSNVPDVVPYLSSAGLMVVPLRIGSGSRLKIIEAAANGLPIVSTRIGAEGLNFLEGRHYLSADQIEDMTKPILQVMRNVEASQEMAAQARTVVEKQYDWDVLAKKQAALWHSVCNQ